jgi:hypothetical protein
MPRPDFVRLCLATSQKYAAEFEAFMRSIGLSADWSLAYSTIDERSIRVSQRGFLDLWTKGEAYLKESPTLWCTQCGTALAQADVEFKDKPSQFTTLRFDLAGGIALPDAYPIAGESLAALAVDPRDESLYGVARTTMGVTHLVRITYGVPGNAATLSAIGSTPTACCYVAVGAATVDLDSGGRALFVLTRDAASPAAMQLTRLDLASGSNTVANAAVEGYALWADAAATLDRIFADDFE